MSFFPGAKWQHFVCFQPESNVFLGISPILSLFNSFFLSSMTLFLHCFQLTILVAGGNKH